MTYHIVSSDCLRTEDLDAAEGPCTITVEWNKVYVEDYREYVEFLNGEASERAYQFERLEVPIPHLGIAKVGRFEEPYLYMSGDGENWARAIFPHIENGYMEMCIQSGSFDIFEENLALNISSFSINYVTSFEFVFWQDLFQLNQHLPKRKEFKNFDAWRDAMNASNTSMTREFMRAWPETELNDMLKFLREKIPSPTKSI